MTTVEEEGGKTEADVALAAPRRSRDESGLHGQRGCRAALFSRRFSIFYIWALFRFGSLALFEQSQTLGKPFRRIFQIPAIPGVSDRDFRR